MKKVYMIHGWAGSSEDNWFPWLKENLEGKGVQVEVFDMPNTKRPKIEEWVKYLEENIRYVDEDTYFIGHSVGVQTIIRFLEKLHKHKKIGGCIFVAGWFNLMNLGKKEMEIAHPWMTSPIDFSRVVDHCDNFLAIFSKDDPYVPLEDSKIFKDKLYSKIVIEENAGHFEKETEPRVLEETLKFLKIK